MIGTWCVLPDPCRIRQLHLHLLLPLAPICMLPVVSQLMGSQYTTALIISFWVSSLYDESINFGLCRKWPICWPSSVFDSVGFSLSTLSLQQLSGKYFCWLLFAYCITVQVLGYMGEINLGFGWNYCFEVVVVRTSIGVFLCCSLCLYLSCLTKVLVSTNVFGVAAQGFSIQGCVMEYKWHTGVAQGTCSRYHSLGLPASEYAAPCISASSSCFIWVYIGTT